jgi:hypothetical protein
VLGLGGVCLDKYTVEPQVQGEVCAVAGIHTVAGAKVDEPSRRTACDAEKEEDDAVLVELGEKAETCLRRFRERLARDNPFSVLEEERPLGDFGRWCRPVVDSAPIVGGVEDLLHASAEEPFR